MPETLKEVARVTNLDGGKIAGSSGVDARPTVARFSCASASVGESVVVASAEWIGIATAVPVLKSTAWFGFEPSFIRATLACGPAGLLPFWS
jgi:hypothetical protein